MKTDPKIPCVEENGTFENRTWTKPEEPELKEPDFEGRVTQVTLVPRGAKLYDKRGFTVGITDEAGGEFLEIECHMDGCGKLTVEPGEWPALRALIDRMAAECRPYRKEIE